MGMNTVEEEGTETVEELHIYVEEQDRQARR